MSLAFPQTPQRPVPGNYMVTPAPHRAQQLQSQSQPPSQPQPPTPTIFQTPSASPQRPGIPPQQPAGSTIAQPVQQNVGALVPVVGSSSLAVAQSMTSLSDIERGARTINQMLVREKKFPELESYILLGSTAEYDTPTSSAWHPFQRIASHQIPDKIFEQYNHAQLSTMMGLFAELNHAWIAIDSSLYIWDYTHPNPELIGFEELTSSITAVELVVPRPGVFKPTITHLLVIATTSEIVLLGLEPKKGPSHITGIELFATDISVSVRGTDVSCIAGSRQTGRIFFAGRTSNDVYELEYNTADSWFYSKCKKINRTQLSFGSGLSALTWSTRGPPEYVTELVVDESRGFLYALSSHSTIRLFHMHPGALDVRITQTWNDITASSAYATGTGSELIKGASIVNLSPIEATESSSITLLAITSTGVRLYLSAKSNSWGSSSLPDSMQVRHVKFPPKNPAPVPSGTASQNPLAVMPAQTSPTTSRFLTKTQRARRFPPGYFSCFVQHTHQQTNEILFMSAPDTARIARPPEQSGATRFPEFTWTIPLDGLTEDVGLVTPPFSANSSPIGFGNELAVQFDQPVTELAILTNHGIQTIRRRRLVDIFAASMRNGGGEEGLEGEIKKFVRLYGRGETAATALAVACGQGSDVTPDAQVANITEPEILDRARKAFIEYGGKPTLNENSVLDQNSNPVDNVRPSPRHEGISLYVSRLVRSIWQAQVIKETSTPGGGLTVTSTVSMTKLSEVQQALTRLQEFLNKNRSFIEGLSGPEALSRISSKRDEIALQGEHRALTSLIRLISNVIEGLAFVIVLFSERTEETILSLSETARLKAQQLTYEGLFCSKEGKDLAKELVKAIVNCSIASGSNVDTVAEALRRRCGSFCSADDVVIFKAQEQLKKASEAGGMSEAGRHWLNESLKLFQRVAASLSMEYLQSAVEQYTKMAFFAGGIELALSVAKEVDPANTALSWIREGSPSEDPRKVSFDARKRCYDLVFQVIEAVDKASHGLDAVNGKYSVEARRANEAYDVINRSEDEAFQNTLYDWYVLRGLSDRLLEIESPHVIAYLRRKASDGISSADLLWRYYAHYNLYFDAASVQLNLAKSDFDISLQQRIEYLSRAKTNASTRTMGMADASTSRQTRQELLREVSDLLDVATIQEELLQRIKGDSRLAGDRRPTVIKQLGSKVLPLDELYNGYADQAGYYDLCLLIYQVADYRNPADVRSTWQNLIEATHQEAQKSGEIQPFELLSERIRSLGRRLNLSEGIFPVPVLVPMLAKYAFASQKTIAPDHWVVDLFLDLQVPPEVLLGSFESLFYNDEAPFQQKNRRVPAKDILHLVQRWLEMNGRRNAGLGPSVLGGEENVVGVAETLKNVQEHGLLDVEGRKLCEALRMRVDRLLR